MEILDDPVANFNMPLYISAALNRKQKIFKAGLFLSVKFSLKNDAKMMQQRLKLWINPGTQIWIWNVNIIIACYKWRPSQQTAQRKGAQKNVNKWGLFPNLPQIMPS